MAKFDLTGVPEFYCPVIGDIEREADGAVRLIYCVRRGGELVPVCSVIRSYSDVIKTAPQIESLCLAKESEERLSRRH